MTKPTLLEECRQRVSSVLGRQLTPAEGSTILSDTKFVMKQLRDADPQFASKSRSEQVRLAATELAKRIEENALNKERARMLQAIKQTEKFNELRKTIFDQGYAPFRALGQMIVRADEYTRGVFNSVYSDLAKILSGIDTNWFGLIEQKGAREAFIRAAFGEKTGTKMDAIYDAYHELSHKLLIRAKEAGLDSGELERYLPQNHDQWKVARTPENEWVDFIFPLLDRSKYLNDDGTLLDDAALREMLIMSYRTIATNGEPISPFDTDAVFHQGVKSGYRRIEHRSLHFKDAESWLQYHDRFGSGTLSDVLQASIRSLTKTIGALENFGPNPTATYNFLKTAVQGEVANRSLEKSSNWFVRAFQDLGDADALGATRTSIDSVWKNFTGEASMSAGIQGSSAFAVWRNLETAGKLGYTFIASWSDLPTYFLSTGYHKIPMWESIRALGFGMGKQAKEYAQTLGIIAEDAANQFNRYTSDNLGQGLSASMARWTLKASGLTNYTDWLRRSFSLVMYKSLAKLAKTDFSSLEAYDRARLERGGISAQDWAVIQKAGVHEYRGVEFLDIYALRDMNPQVAARLIGFIVSESEMASLNPNIIQRAQTNRGMRRGTAGGEFWRAVMLFKSFPLAMMEKQFDRLRFLREHAGRGAQISYAMSLLVGTTLFGALSLQAQQLARGKDMRDMSTKDFWLEAMAKGGGLGFLGDYVANMASDEPAYGKAQILNFLGPNVTTALDIYDLMASGVPKMALNNDTKAAAKALKVVRSHLPFINMWYTGAIVDRAFMNELNETLSPGYMRRMIRRQRKLHGQSFWWNPQDITDMTLPEFATE